MEIYSIIVSYNPDSFKLQQLIDKLFVACIKVIIIDNSDELNYNVGKLLSNCEIISLHENKGIAAAQNIGIRKAISRKADSIIFFDQDSIVTNQLVNEFVKQLNIKYPMVIAPVCIDEKSGAEFPSFQVNRFGIRRKVFRNGRINPYKVDIVISSGLATTVSTFKIVGEMDEDFFIDFVDSEWCLRCKQNNIPINVIPTMLLQHTVGALPLTKIASFTIISHSPLRSYYQIRNSFILLRKNAVPFLFSMTELLSVFLHKFLFILITKERMKHYKMFKLGLLHGIIGKHGKIS